jgi:hypothetical protein
MAEVINFPEFTVGGIGMPLGDGFRCNELGRDKWKPG